MSAREWLHAAILAHLRAQETLDPLRLFDAPPVRAGLPYAVIEDAVLIDWSSKSWTGFEGRLAIVLQDAGERPVRLRTLVGRVEDAVATLPRDLGGEGWQLAQLQFLRSRIVRGSGERWSAVSEFQVRLYQATA